MGLVEHFFKVGKIAAKGETEQRGRTGSGKEGRRRGREESICGSSYPGKVPPWRNMADALLITLDSQCLWKACIASGQYLSSLFTYPGMEESCSPQDSK